MLHNVYKDYAKFLIMEECKRILILSLAGIGDTLMATPLIHELKINFPNSKIDVLVMWNGSKDVLERNPHINEIIHLNMIKEGFWKTLTFCNKLRKREYGISINIYPQGKIQYRIIAKLINAKLRLSHKTDSWGFIDNLLIDKSIQQNYNLQFIENNLNLLELVNAKKKLKKHNYEIYFKEEELKGARDFIENNQIKNKILIGFHVGTGSTKNLALRRWPKENYVLLAKKLLKTNKKIVILLFGGPEEEDSNKFVKDCVGSDRIKLIETKNIRESAAIIRHCEYFICVDTALMHIASAVKVKNLIIIDTPTFNKTVYPYRKNFILIKNPAIIKDKLEYYKYDGKPIKANDEEVMRIMKSISVEKVYSVIKELLR